MTNFKIVTEIAAEYSLDRILVLAICMVESGNRNNVARYEPGYRWLSDPGIHATRLGITKDTETQLQMFSWGQMQIMGATARDLGYMGFLPELCTAQVGILWGCAYLRRLFDKYNSIDDAVAAYNAGSPRLTPDGKYVNQYYVDKIHKHYSAIKGLPS